MRCLLETPLSSLLQNPFHSEMSAFAVKSITARSVSIYWEVVGMHNICKVTEVKNRAFKAYSQCWSALWSNFWISWHFLATHLLWNTCSFLSHIPSYTCIADGFLSFLRKSCPWQHSCSSPPQTPPPPLHLIESWVTGGAWWGPARLIFIMM